MMFRLRLLIWTVGLSSIVWLGVPVAAEGKAAAKTPKELVKELAHDRFNVRRDALAAASALDVAQLEKVVKLLKDKDDPELKVARRKLEGILLKLTFKADKAVRTNSEKVPDGTVVVLRSGNVYGAFVVKDQVYNKQKEQCNYEWVLMPAGVTTIDPKIKGAETGKGEAGLFRKGRGKRPKYIKFGPFTVFWSGNAEGRGWVYYCHLGHKQVNPQARTAMCVMGQRELGKIDVRDEKVRFLYNPRNWK